MTRVNVIISGIVQGVNFRWSTKMRADQLGVTGWVKNTSEGKVKTQFQGSEEQVEAMIDYIKEGPPSASVENVEVEQLEPDNSLNRFDITRG